MQNFDMSFLPDDEISQNGYEELYDVWKQMQQMVEGGKLPDREFMQVLLSRALYEMTDNERNTTEVLNSSLSEYPIEFQHAKLTDKIHKLLMARHNINVN